LEDRVVPSTLIVNGGFETGTFSGWTQGGDMSFTSVNTNLPHSGSYSAELGPTGSDGTLSQTFPTTAGVGYSLDYWLENDGGTPNDFAASINGTTIPGSVLSAAPAFSYTEYTFTFVATGPTTTLMFSFLQNPAYFHLDDVSVNTCNLIVNGGFETGDFTGWTQSGNTGATGVDSGNPHNGTYAAFLGPVGSDGFLAQTFATSPGGTYTLDYWLEHDGGTPSDFYAQINGTTITASSLVNPPAFGYTEYTFSFTTAAGSTSTTLTFGFREDPTYFHLDDVSVMASNLVVNGGFETGDFTGWTQSGDTSYTGVDSSLPHSGTYAAYLGPTGSDGFLSQTFATSPGLPYSLSYWLESDGGTPNDFYAQINGTTISGSTFVDDPGFAYTPFSFTFTGVGTSTTLTFGFLQVPNYWNLDDVSVACVPFPGPPAPHGGGSGGHTPVGGPAVATVQTLNVPAGLPDNTGLGTPVATPALGTNELAKQASLQADHARLVDQIFAGVSSRESNVTLPLQLASTETAHDPLGFELLSKGLWSL
jgi:hypothetical protein